MSVSNNKWDSPVQDNKPHTFALTSYEDSKSKSTKRKAFSWLPFIFLELTAPQKYQSNGQ